MKKIALLVCALTCFSIAAVYGQLSTYKFSSKISAYSPIANDTLLGGTSNDEEVFNNNTAPLYGPRKDIGFPIGFDFYFNNTKYDRFAVETNGYIVLGKDSFTIANLSSGVLGTTSTIGYQNIVAGFNYDLTAQSGATLSYVTKGTAPNRILTVQWKGYKIFASNGTNVNFQINLLETTNQIQIVYGNITLTSSSGMNVQVGLRGANGSDFHARTTATDWTTTSLASSNSQACTASSTVFPAKGLAFLFEPDLPCIAPPAPGMINASIASPACPGTPFALNVSGDSKGSGLSFQWQASPDSLTWNDLTDETGAVYTCKGNSATIYYRRKITCGSSFDVTPGLGMYIKGNVSYAALPFVEGFENNWQNSPCGTNDLPSGYWRNTPATGDTSWRRDDDGASGNWRTPSIGSYLPAGSSNSAHSARFHSSKTQSPGFLDLFLDCSSGQPTKELGFDLINTNGTDSMRILLSIDGGYRFVPIGPVFGAVSSGWNRNTVSFLSSSPTTVLRFAAIGDFGFNDLGIDGVIVQSVSCAMPQMPKVGQIKSATATGSWMGTPGAASYDWEVRQTGNPGIGFATASGNSLDTFTAIAGLTAQTAYNFYVRANCSSSDQSNWVGPFAFTTTPSNDDCTDAVDLTIGGTSVSGSCIAATQSLAPISCLGLSKSAYDVWYKFTTEASRATVTVVGTNLFDAVVQAFDACGGNPVGCVDATTANGTETLILSNLVPGNTYYVRIYSYINTLTGTVPANSSFTVKVASPLVVPGIASTCFSANSVTIDSSNANKWVALVDFSGRILADIYPNGNKLGLVTGKVYINSGLTRLSTNGIYYLNRNIELTPTTQPSTPVTVKLYFLTSELTALRAQTGSGVSSLKDIVVSKTNEPCKSMQTTNGTLLIPSDLRDFGTNGEVATITVNSFSSFYLHGGTVSLPIKLVSFTGERKENGNLLNWAAEGKTSGAFTLEKSFNGHDFASIATIDASPSDLDGTKPYTFFDRYVTPDEQYYRLKMTSADGRDVFSNVVMLKGNKPTGLKITSITPNPVVGNPTLSLYSNVNGKIELRLTDLAGKSIVRKEMEATIGFNKIRLPMATLNAGTYLLIATNPATKESAVFKTVKQ